MNEHPQLSGREWKLILDLLQNERKELPSEIRHTDTGEFRRELEQRREMVDDLITRLSPLVVAA